MKKIQIESRDNPRFKNVRRLLEDGRIRKRQQLLVLEGDHLLRAALDHGWKIRQILVTPSALASDVGRCLEHRLAGNEGGDTEILCLSVGLLTSLSSLESSNGWLVVAEMPTHVKVAPQDRDCVVLDHVQDPGNLGSILRSCLAAGVYHVLLSPGCAGAWAPKTLRSGMGAHFALSIHENSDVESFLKGFEGRRYVTQLDRSSCDLYQTDLVRGPVAWVFGAEGQGVSPEVAACADSSIHIPMTPGIESLNVGAAAAICLFEMVRQRRALS